MITIELLTQPIIRESKEVMVPVYDEYFNEEEKVPGVIQVFQNPVPWGNELNFKFGRVNHQPKFQNIQVYPANGQRIEESTLLKLAHSLGANQVKIREYFQGNWGESNKEERERVKYHLSYGPKDDAWDEPREILQTVEGDLEYEPVLCYGFTRYGSLDNLIIHTQPIASA